MLNCSSEFYSYTEQKSRVQWNLNLIELKKTLTYAHRVWENYGKPNVGCINGKSIMCKRNYKRALKECRRNFKNIFNLNFEDKSQKMWQ